MNAYSRTPSPFVKWAGGKGSLVKYLSEYLPDELVNYYEPFLGGGALFFATYAKGLRFNAFLSDVNKRLINAYAEVKRKPAELIACLQTLQDEYSVAKDKVAYYYHKRESEPSDPLEAAAWFIFLNKTCYNGLYRVSAKDEFNVPFGGYKKPRILDRWTIILDSHALRHSHANLKSTDYIKSVKRCEKGDFVYLDPPYHPTSKTSSFTDYAPGGFSEDKQEELSIVFSDLVHRGCTVLLSNSNTPLIKTLFGKYDTRRILTNRPINCIGTKRRGFKEMIVFGEGVKRMRRAPKVQTRIVA